MNYPHIKKFFLSFCNNSETEIYNKQVIKYMLVVLKINLNNLNISDILDTHTCYTYEMFLDLIKSQDLVNLNTHTQIYLLELVDNLNNKLNKSTTNYIVKNVFNINDNDLLVDNNLLVDINIIKDKLNNTYIFDI